MSEKATCVLCGELGELKKSAREKPFFRCDNCGVIIFANKELSMSLLEAQASGDVPVVDKEGSPQAPYKIHNGNFSMGDAVAELKAIRKRLDALEAQGKVKAPKAQTRKKRETAAEFLYGES